MASGAARALDRYLLGEPVSKQATIDAALADRVAAPAAQPFYRALEAVGVRAADEALIALRLVLAGREASDMAVRRLRAVAAAARAQAMGDARGAKSAIERDRDVLPDFPRNDGADLGRTAQVAYEAELAG